MKKTLLLFAILAVCFNLSSQTSPDSITSNDVVSTISDTVITPANPDMIVAKKVFGGYMFYKNDKPLNMYQLTNLLRTDEKAIKGLNQAKSTNILVSILSYAGGYLIGWPCGTAMAGGKADWKLAGIGAGLVAIALPISSIVSNQTKKAVEIYNQGKNTGSLMEETEWKVGLTGNGLGLIVSF